MEKNNSDLISSLLDERAELVERCVKLSSVLDLAREKNLNFLDLNLLRAQLHAMTSYSAILSCRIARLRCVE